jgi:pyruvate kinase
MIDEGVRVCRVNFSHGTFEDFAHTVRIIREASARAGIPAGILGDLSGPKIRVTDIEDGRIELNTGDRVEFMITPGIGRRNTESGVVTLHTTYPDMVREVDEGHRVLLNDGAIRMLVTDQVSGDHRDDPRLVCMVTHGGPLTPKKGVNLPDSRISIPSLTDWDRQCARWAVENDLDFLALSFVRSAADVQELIDLLRTLGRDNRVAQGTRNGESSRMPIIAKIEKPQAIAELEPILRVADGVMVARGDLGVEMDVAEVPVLQKRIIRAAHAIGKPVIVATQMLESMIHEPTPTRAEVSDVANAIMDGADATMLSGETAVGKWPTICVQTMARTARVAEAHMAVHGLDPTLRPVPQSGQSRYRTAALARGVAAIVKELDPRYVVVWSQLGGGALYLSQARLRRPILAFSSNQQALRQMTLLYGVHPIYLPQPEDAEQFVLAVDALLQDQRWADPGDPIVIVKGSPLGVPGVTNKIRIHYVADVCKV